MFRILALGLLLSCGEAPPEFPLVGTWVSTNRLTVEYKTRGRVTFTKKCITPEKKWKTYTKRSRYSFSDMTITMIKPVVLGVPDCPTVVPSKIEYQDFRDEGYIKMMGVRFFEVEG